MGVIAEMMLDGTLCEGCGSYIDDCGGFGAPRYCSPQCARDRGAAADAPPSDAECIDYLNNTELRGDPDAILGLRLFMGVGKKRAKRLVAQWNATTRGASL